jgi:translocation and assembly module TamB
MVRAKEGRFLIDPIDTSLNGGRLHVEPELRLAKETGETSAILVHEGTSIRDAEINDTVSKRVLAFVAPVLDSATRVNGKVSAEIDEGVFPLGTEGTKGLKLEGDLIFQDVQFLPGPLFNELLAVTGRSDRPLLRLNDPVALTIADRRVYQSGLKIPVGKLGNIEIEGWVDFDQNMNLVTSVPILPNVLAERPLLGGLAGDARIKIPVQGTLKAPEINKEAFDIGMKDLGKTMLDRTVGTGLSDLIRSMGERAKAAPPAPRLTPAERRERRLEKKRDRQAKRGLIP